MFFLDHQFVFDSSSGVELDGPPGSLRGRDDQHDDSEDVKIEDEHAGSEDEDVDLGDDRITDDEEDLEDEDRKKFSSFGLDPLTGTGLCSPALEYSSSSSSRVSV